MREGRQRRVSAGVRRAENPEQWQEGRAEVAQRQAAAAVSGSARACFPHRQEMAQRTRQTPQAVRTVLKRKR